MAGTRQSEQPSETRRGKPVIETFSEVLEAAEARSRSGIWTTGLGRGEVPAHVLHFLEWYGLIEPRSKWIEAAKHGARGCEETEKARTLGPSGVMKEDKTGTAMRLDCWFRLLLDDNFARPAAAVYWILCSGSGSLRFRLRGSRRGENGS